MNNVGDKTMGTVKTDFDALKTPHEVKYYISSLNKWFLYYKKRAESDPDSRSKHEKLCKEYAEEILKVKRHFGLAQ